MTPKIPDPPKMPDPVRIPSPDDPELIAARRRKMQEDAAGRQGRGSTMLSNDSTATGTPSFNRTTLG